MTFHTPFLVPYANVERVKGQGPQDYKAGGRGFAVTSHSRCLFSSLCFLPLCTIARPHTASTKPSRLQSRTSADSRRRRGRPKENMAPAEYSKKTWRGLTSHRKRLNTLRRIVPSCVPTGTGETKSKYHCSVSDFVYWCKSVICNKNCSATAHRLCRSIPGKPPPVGRSPAVCAASEMNACFRPSRAPWQIHYRIQHTSTIIRSLITHYVASYRKKTSLRPSSSSSSSLPHEHVNSPECRHTTTNTSACGLCHTVVRAMASPDEGGCGRE